MKTKKLYTISTLTFKSLKEVEKKILEWDEKDYLDEKSIIFEVKAMFKPIIKKTRDIKIEEIKEIKKR